MIMDETNKLLKILINEDQLKTLIDVIINKQTKSPTISKKELLSDIKEISNKNHKLKELK
jgi:hypothetical protein